jgi:hypothetical protein
MLETENLARLIDRKLEVLTQLHSLALRQLQLVSQGEAGLLIGLLAAKQRLLTPLQSIEDEMKPFQGQDPDRRQWRSPQDRQRTRGVVDQCESVLRDIVKIEVACERELLRRRELAAGELRGTHSAAQAVQAYISAGPAPIAQLDLSSDT